ncbi:MAG: hypothetical protein JKY00_16200 [Roseicyclus sp.]|nr:hypothetical protein [Roseicyclus sp.]
MSENDDVSENGDGAGGSSGGEKSVVPFPFSRSGVAKTRQLARNLGLTELSAKAKRSGRGAKGHWCRSCKGIWYSYFFEVECPVCGRRG